MSLINDALKKTQRMRADPEDNSSTVGAYGAPRGRVKSGPSVTTLALGAVFLVAVAVGGTLLLLRSKSSAPSVAARTVETSIQSNTAPASMTASAPTTAVVAPPPLIVAPVLTAAKSPEPAPALVSAPVNAEASTAPVAAAPVTRSKLDVANFIDAIHVTGVRFSEGSSKVLMNDHVYKVNDVVERALNIRLIEVKSDSLTFVDETGTVYKKSF